MKPPRKTEILLLLFLRLFLSTTLANKEPLAIFRRRRVFNSLIMPWSASQQQRLGFEKDLLEKYFRGRVSWINPTGDTRVEVKVTCTNDKQYTLRVYLPSDYPSSCPDMVVKSPYWFGSYLKKKDGTKMSDADGEDHTYGNRDGCTQICHFNPSLWQDDNTLYQVFMKGLIWLEAYEAHLRTGKSLSTYLREM